MSHCMKITKKSYLCVKFLIDPLKLSLQTQMLLYEVRESSTFLRSVGISKNQPNLESKHPNMSLLLLKCLYKPNFQFLSSVQKKLYFRHRISKFYHHRISCYFEIPQQDDESCFAKNLTDQSQFTLYISTTQKTHLSHTTTT